ncbi:MAG: PadR family transcriptional regulator [Bacteroidales bacterium]|nr:PadR family transcriptional regulator [Bacteroidales bacterium]MBN2749380.1 PadR family transcriptional regulator [Bacteroidales bacterium]
MISNDLLKGTLRTIVLKLLKENKRLYGYEITQKVEDLSGGKVKLTFGALYPVLHKLEAEGYLVTEKVHIGKRVRIYYSLTPEGVSWAQALVDEFEDFVNTMQLILQPYPVK